MSVTSFQRISAKGRVVRGQPAYTGIWRAITTSIHDGPEKVLEYAQSVVPAGSYWTWLNGGVDTRARISTYGPAELEHEGKLGTSWLCPLEFEPEGNTDSSGDSDPPWEREWSLGGSFLRYMRATSIDKDGKPIANSVEQEQPQEIPASTMSLVLSGSTRTFPVDVIANAMDKVNDATWWGREKRVFRLDQWRHQVKRHDGIFYVQHTVEIGVNLSGWNTKIIDRGTRVVANVADFLLGGNPKYISVHDLADNVTREPVFLDGGELRNGVRVGGRAIDLSSQQPFELTFKVLKETTFDNLPLPVTLPAVYT